MGFLWYTNVHTTGNPTMRYIVTFSFADVDETKHDKTSSRQARNKNISNSEDDSDDNEDIMRIDVAPKEQWDCESILSKYID